MRNKYLSVIMAVLLLLSCLSLACAEAQPVPPVVESVTMERKPADLSTVDGLAGYGGATANQR